MSKLEVNTIAPQCGTTLTLGESGDTVTLGTGASQSGFGRTGTVDWVTTPKVTGDSPLTVSTGSGYFLNTTAGTITVNLPAGAAGSIVSLADYAGTWQTYNVTVTPNGTDKIGGVNADATLNTQGQSVTLVYVDAVQGWINTMDSTSNVRASAYITASVSGACNTLTTSGNCKIAKFVGPGTFTVCAVANCAANNEVSYVVVAGGAGGGATNGGSWGAGGGGAGGYRETKSPIAPYTASPLDGYSTPGNRITVSATGYPITVGGGGAAGSTSSGTANGSSGGVSTFDSITSAGGGGGGAGAGPGTPGANGGSGGGGGSSNGAGDKGGGTGNTPSVTPAQGKDGGDSADGNAPASGGGGATVKGSDSVPGTNVPQPGGAGATTNIIATPVTYSAGGASADYPAVAASNAGDNTGNGGKGGGGNAATSGNGGSGIVVIRYRFQ